MTLGCIPPRQPLSSSDEPQCFFRVWSIPDIALCGRPRGLNIQLVNNIFGMWFHSSNIFYKCQGRVSQSWPILVPSSLPVREQAAKVLQAVAAVGSSHLHRYVVVQNLRGYCLVIRNHPELTFGWRATPLAWLAAQIAALLGTALHLTGVVRDGSLLMPSRKIELWY